MPKQAAPAPTPTTTGTSIAEQIQAKYAKGGSPTLFEQAQIYKEINNAPINKLSSLSESQAKKALKEATASGEPTVIQWHKKGEGRTTVTLNKEISFSPDPDLKLNKLTEFNNNNKEFAGIKTSTGEPVTVKLPYTRAGESPKNITVHNAKGDIIGEFDIKGKRIK
jgi:hypothetical protein